MSKQISYVATFGRFLIAVIFLVSGYGKITEPTMTLGYINAVHLPLPIFAYTIAIIVEIGGSLFLILGLQTRIIGVTMAIYCVATALSFHNNFADPNQMMNFLKNISMAGGLLQVVAFGAGSFSLDKRLVGSQITTRSAI
ncbi:DoxX family protein [Paraburkholderia dipogonis]|jgi:putative oxidoreductase|uniref:DoxX family protein n=1 Tax=Paraburkholderia dipogonis TaxID=1211383 RepID=UPI0038BB25AF